MPPGTGGLRFCGDAAPAKPTTEAPAGDADELRRAPRLSDDDSEPPPRELAPSDALP